MTKLEELKAKRATLDAKSDATIEEMRKIADESLRLADELRQKREELNKNKK